MLGTVLYRRFETRERGRATGIGRPQSKRESTCISVETKTRRTRVIFTQIQCIFKTTGEVIHTLCLLVEVWLLRLAPVGKPGRLVVDRLELPLEASRVQERAQVEPVVVCGVMVSRGNYLRRSICDRGTYRANTLRRGRMA